MKSRPENQNSAVGLDQLSGLERMLVKTRNHVYEIVVPAEDNESILLRGGTAFPEFVPARLVGSVRDGFRFRAIAVGSRVQFETEDGLWLMTTPVEAVAVTSAETPAAEARV